MECVHKLGGAGRASSWWMKEKARIAEKVQVNHGLTKNGALHQYTDSYVKYFEFQLKKRVECREEKKKRVICDLFVLVWFSAGSRVAE